MTVLPRRPRLSSGVRLSVLVPCSAGGTKSSPALAPAPTKIVWRSVPSFTRSRAPVLVSVWSCRKRAGPRRATAADTIRTTGGGPRTIFALMSKRAPSSVVDAFARISIAGVGVPSSGTTPVALLPLTFRRWTSPKSCRTHAGPTPLRPAGQDTFSRSALLQREHGVRP